MSASLSRTSSTVKTSGYYIAVKDAERCGLLVNRVAIGELVRSTPVAKVARQRWHTRGPPQEPTQGQLPLAMPGDVATAAPSMLTTRPSGRRPARSAGLPSVTSSTSTPRPAPSCSRMAGGYVSPIHWSPRRAAGQPGSRAGTAGTRLRSAQTGQCRGSTPRMSGTSGRPRGRRGPSAACMSSRSLPLRTFENTSVLHRHLYQDVGRVVPLERQNSMLV